MQLKGAYSNEPFEIAGTLGPIMSLVNPEESWPVDLSAKAYGITLSVSGTIDDPLTHRGMEIKFEAKGSDLKKLSELGGISLPIKGPFGVSGRFFDTAPKTYKISDLKVGLGDSDINGSLETRFVDNRLLLTAEFSSQNLDFRPILSKTAVSGEKKKSTKANKSGAKVFPDDPLPVDALSQADASISIQIDQLLLPRFSFNNLNVTLTLEDGFLTIKPIEASIGGGTLDGQFELESLTETAALASRMKIDQLDLGNMLRELEAGDAVEGNVDIEIDLKSRGNSIAALMGGLNGNATMLMDNGRIENKYINLLGGDLSSGIYRLLNPGGQKENYTKVNCFVNRFDIRDGLADCTVLVFDTERMSVVGEGEINLKTEKLNLSLKPVPKEGVGTSDSRKYSLSLGELAKPFKLGGTLASPSLVIDSRQAAKMIGKAAGGVMLFGPIGIAAALLSGSSDEEDLCLAASEAAKRGVKLSASKESKGGDGSTRRTTEGGKEKGKGIGSKLKQLFGR